MNTSSITTDAERATIGDPAGWAELTPVAVASRSGADESVHFGMAVGLDPSGTVVVSVGDPTTLIYPRSANKPLQADAMLALGLQLSETQLALACASHSGTGEHTSVVESILAVAGLGVAALDNTPTLPLDEPAARAELAGGGGPSSLLQNCSGKHAAMVATCVVNGWPVEGYLAVDHPLQVAITAHLAGLADVAPHIGVDGCGVPAHMMSLAGLARSFGALAASGSAVFHAMSSQPYLVGGAGRDVTRLMELVPGLMAKDGAEGVFAAALPDGRCAAVKIADGASRASGVVIAATLRALGLDVDPADLGEPIQGHGRPVGVVRPTAIFGASGDKHGD